ncbi:MAG: hypothetical protein JNJ78_04245 [Anaerolineae bacterium]|nr:hypothetical protein [Anaerolineae bacterium]
MSRRHRPAFPPSSVARTPPPPPTPASTYSRTSRGKRLVTSPGISYNQ